MRTICTPQKERGWGWGWGKGLERRAGKGSGEKILQIHKAFWKLLSWDTSTPPPSSPLHSQAALYVVKKEISRHLTSWGQNLVNLHEYTSQRQEASIPATLVSSISALCVPQPNTHTMNCWIANQSYSSSATALFKEHSQLVTSNTSCWPQSCKA